MEIYGGCVSSDLSANVFLDSQFLLILMFVFASFSNLQQSALARYASSFEGKGSSVNLDVPSLKSGVIHNDYYLLLN
jgi:hypothetical protein